MTVIRALFKLPIILLAIIVFVWFLGPMLPYKLQAGVYSISVIIKELLIFILPLIIFSLLFSSLLHLSGKALKLILILVPMICCSNFLTTIIAYVTGNVALEWIDLSTNIAAMTGDLQPLWQFKLPSWCPNQVALLSALVLAIVFIIKDALYPHGMELSKKIGKFFSDFAIITLRHGFIPVVPIFMLGFLLKLQHDGALQILVRNYFYVFISIVAVELCYTTLLYVLASNFKFNRCMTYVKNMLPAGLTGFATMSSAAAMPFTLQGVKANTNNLDIPHIVVPTTVNIHLVGDCIAIPIFALAILESFAVPMPGISTYLIFAGYFVLAKFAVAAVPGGGILVMLPVLQQYLGFSGEMGSLITALYIMSDAVTTGFNIMGNGAFSILLKKLFAKLGLDKIGRTHSS